jgi:hypothetical protein
VASSSLRNTSDGRTVEQMSVTEIDIGVAAPFVWIAGPDPLRVMSSAGAIA